MDAAAAVATSMDNDAAAPLINAEDDHDSPATSILVPVSTAEQKNEGDTLAVERTSNGNKNITLRQMPALRTSPKTCGQVCCTKNSFVTTVAGMVICMCLSSECVLFTARMAKIFHYHKETPDEETPTRFGSQSQLTEGLVQSALNGATLLGVIVAFLVAKPFWPAHNVFVTVTVLITLLVLDFMTAFSSERKSYWFLQLWIDASLYVSLILYFNFVDVPDNRCKKCCCSLQDVLLWINAGLVVVFMIFVFSINTIMEQHEIGELTGTINGANLLRYLVGITEGLLLFEILHDALQRVKQVCQKRHAAKCFKDHRKKRLAGKYGICIS